MVAATKASLEIKAPKIAFRTAGGMLLKGDGGVNIAAPKITTRAGKVFGAQGNQVQATAKLKQVIAVAKTYGGRDHTGRP